jgi:hypothetical protein
MRVRMNSALGITEQGLGSADACRVPWPTKPQRLQRNLEAGATDHPAPALGRTTRWPESSSSWLEVAACRP